MEIGEAIFKIFVTFFLWAILYSKGVDLYVSFFMAHSFNFMFNAQPLVVLRYYTKVVEISEYKLIKFKEFASRISVYFDVIELYAYGSFSKKRMRKSSDLDLRVYHRPDFISSLMAYVYVMILRAWSTINLFPLDVYAFSDVKFISKLNNDEIPVCFICENNNTLKNFDEHIVEVIIE